MSLILQPRDFAILTDLGDYGLLDTPTIHRRHWPAASTIRGCQNRLSKLGEQGLIRSASLVVAYQATRRAVSDQTVVGGSLPTVFCLTPHGAELLENETGYRPRRVHRGDVQPATLLHRLAGVQTRITVDAAALASKIARPDWLLEYDTYDRAPLDAPHERRFILHERFTTNAGDVACRPDLSCLIFIPRSLPGQPADPLLVYWEIDRSNTTHARELEKANGYAALLASDRPLHHWPVLGNHAPVIRVFYVCESPERLRSLSGSFATHPIASRCRLTTKTLLAERNPLTDAIWHDPEGKLYSVIK